MITSVDMASPTVGQEAVTSINLSHNRLTGGVIVNATTVPINDASLDLSFNAITQLSLSPAGSFVIVNASFNAITSLQPGFLSSYAEIETLDLSFNNISAVAEEAFGVNVMISNAINLSHNRLTSISEQGLFPPGDLGVKTKIWDLSHNVLSIVPDGIFQRLRDVESVSSTLSRARYPYL